MRLIVGMTGATGAPLGVELLQALRAIPDVETHLVMSKWAKTTIELETPYTPAEVAALADYCHSPADQAATISSGSFRTDGMIIIPCSMKTLAGVRAGYAEGLVGRAADVVLKEGRKLVLVPREMPAQHDSSGKHASAFSYGGGDSAAHARVLQPAANR